MIDWEFIKALITSGGWVIIALLLFGLLGEFYSWIKRREYKENKHKKNLL